MAKPSTSVWTQQVRMRPCSKISAAFQSDPWQTVTHNEVPDHPFVGSPSGTSFAVAITRPMGTVVQKSTCSAQGGAPLSVSLVNTIVVDEIKLVGSRCGPFDVAMEMLLEPEIQNLLEVPYPACRGRVLGPQYLACRPHSLVMHYRA